MIAVLAMFVVAWLMRMRKHHLARRREQRVFGSRKATDSAGGTEQHCCAAKSGDKPLMFQVGSRVLFEQAHIAGFGVHGAGIAAGGARSV